MPGKFPTKVVGSRPTNKDGHVAVNVVMPEPVTLKVPGMRDLMKATNLTKGVRRPGKDG